MISPFWSGEIAVLAPQSGWSTLPSVVHALAAPVRLVGAWTGYVPALRPFCQGGAYFLGARSAFGCIPPESLLLQGKRRNSMVRSYTDSGDAICRTCASYVEHKSQPPPIGWSPMCEVDGCSAEVSSLLPRSCVSLRILAYAGLGLSLDRAKSGETAGSAALTTTRSLTRTARTNTPTIKSALRRDARFS